MKRILRFTFQGLALVLPLLVTLWVVVAVVHGIEQLLAGPLETLLGQTATDDQPATVGALGLETITYVPGMGVAVAVVLLIAVGLAARVWFVDRLVHLIEGIVGRIPLVKTLYGSVRDLLGFMSGTRQSFSRVVLVTLPGTGQKVVGLVTRERLDELRGMSTLSGRLAVFVSMSYNIGGFTLLVPADEVEEVDMSVEDAMRFSLTGGVSIDPSDEAGPTALTSPGPGEAAD